jgi:site-specific DNA-adenine methylase
MRYPGGKGKLYRNLINLIPKHKVYIECFLGGGAVLRHKKPAEASIGIDLDERALARCNDLSVHVPTLQLIHDDAIQFLRDYSFQGDEFVYADPPYLPETRRRPRLYRHEYTRDDHVALIEVLLNLPCAVMISGYDSPLYRKLLRGWRHLTFRAKTHVDVREESVWMNYAEPAVLHDARYLGNSFRERQQIQRRLATMRRRFYAMSPPERAELLLWASEQFGEQEAACRT